ncbi:unnamed protein product [Pocillopora meandrina]|uniref:C-type lectin domain-containing protein n=1 Tax=Pocillopora meandrina TaxID=46732 RepID=A0AAU9XUI1_9CNID|nr:unnamed protein product [Pocillopora meandrina]
MGQSWLLNRETCQNQGGDLVSMETEDEWNFINDQIQRRDITRYENKWSIGLTKKAENWTWVNGRPLTICKWEQGEPRGEHDVAFMYKRSSNGEQGVFGGVNGISIRYGHGYICEISVGKLLFLLLFFRKEGLTFVMYTSHFSNFSSFKLIFSHNLACFTSNPQRLVPSIRIGKTFPFFPLDLVGFLSRVGTQNVFLREKYFSCNYGDLWCYNTFSKTCVERKSKRSSLASTYYKISVSFKFCKLSNGDKLELRTFTPSTSPPLSPSQSSSALQSTMIQKLEAIAVLEIFITGIKKITKARNRAPTTDEIETRRGSTFKVAIAFEEFALKYSKLHLTGTRSSQVIDSQTVGDSEFVCLFVYTVHLIQLSEVSYLNSRIMAVAMDPKPNKLEANVI